MPAPDTAGSWTRREALEQFLRGCRAIASRRRSVITFRDEACFSTGSRPAQGGLGKVDGLAGDSNGDELSGSLGRCDEASTVHGADFGTVGNADSRRAALGRRVGDVTSGLDTIEVPLRVDCRLGSLRLRDPNPPFATERLTAELVVRTGRIRAAGLACENSHCPVKRDDPTESVFQRDQAQRATSGAGSARHRLAFG